MKNINTLYIVGVLFSSLLFSCNRKTTLGLEPTEADSVQIQTYLWPSTSNDLHFPEDGLDLPKTGICMSGGGTRAMVCAIGQFKALREIGVLDDIGYLSCVSGGSWASVPFTYYTSGAANDDELLGTIIPPDSLTIDGMGSFTKGFLGAAANCPLLDVMVGNLGTYATDNIWIQGVSECYMEPFGLYDQDAPKYFSYNAASVADICQRNPSLSPSDFNTVRNNSGDSKRPYLVVNSSISGPYKYAPFKSPEDLAVMNYTPLGIGSAVLDTAVYRPEINNDFNSLLIGGGFIEPFAFGSQSPHSFPTRCSTLEQRSLCVNVLKPSTPFPIASASGTSSSAFVAAFTSHGIDGYSLSDLSPRMEYWPIPINTIQPNIDFMFGDGGNLENLGAISLLQRKVNNLVVFVNTDTAINTDYNQFKDGLPSKTDVSSDILTLFGVQFSGSENMNKNQVFNQSDVYDLMTKLINAKIEGDSIIVQTTHTTINNPWWGIQAGDTVNIVWVYNDIVNTFVNALESEIRIPIEDLNGFPLFTNFPLYATVDEDLLRLVKLSAEQINLLYQFSAWHVYTNKDYFNFLTSDK